MKLFSRWCWEQQIVWTACEKFGRLVSPDRSFRADSCGDKLVRIPDMLYFFSTENQRIFLLVFQGEVLYAGIYSALYR